MTERAKQIRDPKEPAGLEAVRQFRDPHGAAVAGS